MPRFKLQAGDIVIPVDDIYQGDTLAIDGKKQYEVVDVDDEGDAGVIDELGDTAYLVNSKFDDEREIAKAFRDGVEILLTADFEEKLEEVIEGLQGSGSSEGRYIGECMDDIRRNGDASEEHCTGSLETFVEYARGAVNDLKPGSYTTVHELIKEFAAPADSVAYLACALDAHLQVYTQESDNEITLRAMRLARAILCRLSDDDTIPNIPLHV